jgi:WS/DGAT/MGAT family acyltransferase
VSNLVKAITSMAAKPDPTPWNVPVTRHRRWARTEVGLEVVQPVRDRCGATINDVVLAACTGALRQFLEKRGENVDGRILKAMVPISLRGEDQHGETLGNLVALVLLDLPVDEPDATRRLERIHGEVRELRDSGLVEGGQLVTRIADGVTPLAAPLTRYVARSLPMNLVITNIPGPPMTLYLSGARLMRAYPYVEVVDNEGLTIAVVSYDERLHFGITSDRDVIPDLDDLGDAIAANFRELADSV